MVMSLFGTKNARDRIVGGAEVVGEDDGSRTRDILKKYNKEVLA